jgi:hypothetical protein
MTDDEDMAMQLLLEEARAKAQADRYIELRMLDHMDRLLNVIGHMVIVTYGEIIAEPVDDYQDPN